MTPALATDIRGAGGVPLLFAHSFAGDLSHWSSTLEHLRAQRRAVAFDFRAHGKSPPAAGHYSYDELAKDIGAVADEADLDRFVLVGHSMGAAIAIEYAAMNAPRVKALVLVDPPPRPGAIPPEQVEQIHDALEKDPHAVVEQYWTQQMFVDSRPEVRRRLLVGLGALPREATIELTKQAFAVDSSHSLRRYPGHKFAIVTPRNDTPLSLHNAVPEVKHAVVKGTGHWIHLDDADGFNRTLDEFLKRI